MNKRGNVWYHFPFHEKPIFFSKYLFQANYKNNTATSQNFVLVSLLILEQVFPFRGYFNQARKELNYK